MSNDAKIVSFGTVSGMLLRKSFVSLRYLVTCFVKGRKSISIRLLSLCVWQEGPATIGDIDYIIYIIKRT